MVHIESYCDSKLSQAHLHASSSVNANDFPVYPLTILACEEAYNSCDIDWKAYSVQRTPCRRVLSKSSAWVGLRMIMVTHLINTIIGQVCSVGDIFSAHFVVHICLNSTRCYAVDSDLLVAHICCLIRPATGQ